MKRREYRFGEGYCRKASICLLCLISILMIINGFFLESQRTGEAPSTNLNIEETEGNHIPREDKHILTEDLDNSATSNYDDRQIIGDKSASEDSTFDKSQIILILSILLIILVIGIIIIQFLEIKSSKEKETSEIFEDEEMSSKEAGVGLIEEKEPEPEEYEEIRDGMEESAIIEEEKTEPVEYEEVSEPREELVKDEETHEEHLGQDILVVWNEKYESKGYLSTICPSCFEESEFKVQTTDSGKDFICPNCRAKYAFKG